MAYYSTTVYNQNDVYSISDDSSVSSHMSGTSANKNHKKILRNQRRLDPDYVMLKRKIFKFNPSTDVNELRDVKLELYKSSFKPNMAIRNAVTGIYENCRVGTSDSNMMFKVIIATGETGPNPIHLYFDSPEQYERFFGTVISNDLKSAWKMKYNNAFKHHIDPDKPEIPDDVKASRKMRYSRP